MYKVLIVDDEPIVREGLEFIIDWQDFGFTIIDNAENGRICIEKIHSLNPDLVITDVRMPGIDGIEMIKKIRNKGIDTHFIILSGYSDFTYAKEALSLNVVSYLLKPIEEAELIEELLKIKEELKEKETFETSLMNYHQYETASKIKSYLLKQTAEIGELKQLLISEVYILIGCVYNPKKTNRQELENALPRIKDQNFYQFNHEDIVYFLVEAESPKSFEQYIQKLIEFTEAYKEQLTLTVSSIVHSIEELKIAYSEINQLKEKNFLYPEQTILTPHLLKNKKDQKDVNQEITSLKDQLIKAIEENKQELIIELMPSFFSVYQQSNVSVEEIKADLIGIYLVSIHLVEKYREEPFTEKEKNDTISKFLKSPSLTNLLTVFEEILISLANSLSEVLATEDIISRIKRYTLNYYYQELSMIELANHFNYSHSYLGKKFRSETGKSYHTYLNEIRIEKAKILLKESSLYIYEISERVGFSNPDYFHKKFKEKVGKSPKQYRIEFVGGE